MLVVYTYLDDAAHAYFREFAVDWAPPAYRSRLEQKTHPTAYVQSIAGLWLLGRALERTGSDADITAIHFDADDCPRLPRSPAFSISHSDHFAACAVTDAPRGACTVGLDIEEPRELPQSRVKRLACNDSERALFAQQPTRFFDYWCAREATVKATGRVGLKRIRQIHLDGNTAWLDGSYWYLRPLTLAPDLRACLACDSPDEQVQTEYVAVPLES